jgi:SAM-dependent methyltransferase
MSASYPQVPPPYLASRVGLLPGDTLDPLEAYEREGAAVRARIERFLPPDWTFDGKRVLDFGCGSARVLRHFLPEAERAGFWGCDIDGPSIEWVRAHLCPPLHCFQNASLPPLALEDETFDLIWATSVFTHIDSWAPWLLDMHRILKPGGTLIASFLGEGMWEALVQEPYREDEIGMTVRNHWTKQDAWVFHSEWWLREHWGRAFEVVDVERPPRLPDGSPEVTHSYIVGRKRVGSFTSEELERCHSDEPRELASLQTNLRLQRDEIETLDRLARAPTPPPALSAVARDAIVRSPLGPLARSLRRRLRPRPDDDAAGG